MFRRIRTRRAIKKAEKNSGLKQENSIFRGKGKIDKSYTSSIIPNLTATLSEESETEGVNSIYGTSNVQECVDVDVSMNTQELNHNLELIKRDNEIVQMKLVIDELKFTHENELTEKDKLIQEAYRELDQTRQDFLEVIVDASAKEQELSATKEQLIRTEFELRNVTKDLFTTKEKLNVLGSSLIQNQHKLHLAQDELQRRRQPFGFLYI